MARISLTRHRKFRRFARALGSPALALGTLELIWLVAYEAADPFIGTAADLEDAAGWSGAPGALAPLLVECGLLDAVGSDGFAVHDLWQHAPDYVRLRWTRTHPQVLENERPWNLSTSCVGKTSTSRPDPSVPSDQKEQRASARDPDPPNPRVLGRLVYELPDDLEDETDKKEELKTLAVRYGLNYDAGSIAHALDAAAHARRRQLWIRDPYYGKRPAALRRRRAR
jgi:hypothetical protein